MSNEVTCPEITIQSSVNTVGKQLAILLTSSYLSFGYTNGVMLRRTTVEGMKDLNKREAEFF